MGVGMGRGGGWEGRPARSAPSLGRWLAVPRRTKTARYGYGHNSRSRWLDLPFPRRSIGVLSGERAITEKGDCMGEPGMCRSRPFRPITARLLQQ